jgi:hypothetical protein
MSDLLTPQNLTTALTQIDVDQMQGDVRKLG